MAAGRSQKLAIARDHPAAADHEAGIDGSNVRDNDHVGKTAGSDTSDESVQRKMLGHIQSGQVRNSNYRFLLWLHLYRPIYTPFH